MLGSNHIVIHKCIKLTCDRKAFLSEQCKEIEEKSRMGKTSDLFKKIGDIKGTLHATLGMINDRNVMDLTSR